jgi:hypothetical protein
MSRMATEKRAGGPLDDPNAGKNPPVVALGSTGSPAFAS